MYGCERVYRSMMGPGQLFIYKICRKFNIEDKNIEKYAFFGETVFLQGKNTSSTIYLPNIEKVP
jgi:hypothetical protein